MTQYRLIVLGHLWQECLYPARDILDVGLEEAGLRDSSGRTIVLGAHAYPEFLAADDIIYQTEHPATHSPAYRQALATHEVWQYSRHAGPGTYCPLGAVDVEQPTLVAKEYDLLFVGSINPRRKEILTQLGREFSLQVHTTINPIFGAELAAAEARARIVLNLHHYLPGIFESSRVVPATLRGATVVSEPCVGDEGGEWCTQTNDLVSTIQDILSGKTPPRKQQRRMSTILKDIYAQKNTR